MNGIEQKQISIFIVPSLKYMHGLTWRFLAKNIIESGGDYLYASHRSGGISLLLHFKCLTHFLRRHRIATVKLRHIPLAYWELKYSAKAVLLHILYNSTKIVKAENSEKSMICFVEWMKKFIWQRLNESTNCEGAWCAQRAFSRRRFVDHTWTRLLVATKICEKFVRLKQRHQLHHERALSQKQRIRHKPHGLAVLQEQR